MQSFEQLKMFVAAAEAGSFSAAGRQLNKGQSAVSLGIANLEVDLGFDLFDRTTRKPGLTPEGSRLLGHAKAVLMQLEDLDIAARSVFAGEETNIRLVLDAALMVPAFETLLTEFSQRFPATEISVISSASPEIPTLIENGNADIGLMFSQVKVQKNLEQSFIGNLPFVAVSSPAYGLSKITSIGASELLPFRQLLLQSPEGSELDQFPALSTMSWKADSFYSLRDLAIMGLGWVYLPKHMVKEAMRDGRLVALNFRFEHQDWSPPVECVSLKNRDYGPALSWLNEKIKDVIAI
ncbi:MAG: LysR family transcriptional regulator [Sneathiellales bacterium]|nr:LysR family transcriptional regulator [Sneathiellales bacterium]